MYIIYNLLTRIVTVSTYMHMFDLHWMWFFLDACYSFVSSFLLLLSLESRPAM